MAKKDTPAVAPPTPAGAKFARTRAVTLPILKFVEEVPRFLTLTGEMFTGKEQKADKPGEKPMEPATLCHATDLETGELGQIIVNTALVGILNEEYPNTSYVGKSFELTKHAKKDGKRYNTFSVFEVDPTAK